MKRISILSLLLLAVAMVVVVGSVGAYMRKQTPVLENDFTPAVVSCKVDENVENNRKTSIKVKNTGTIESYLRLRLVTYWMVENESDGKRDVTLKSSNVLDFFYNTSDWIKDGDTYYYKKPVLPGASTEELLGSSEGIRLNYNSVDQSYQVIDVFAEAIQSLPENAVEESWGVTLDDNGNISSVN